VTVLLKANGLSKIFGTVSVLNDISCDVRSGEIHAIIGENGAGKSTLMRLLAGHVQPSAGSLELDGKTVSFAGPATAEEAGIVLVHQEILLAEGLSVAENLFLGREIVRHGIIDDAAMNKLAAAKLAEIGCHVAPKTLVKRLAIADRQLVQIARALLVPHRLVIFDEPTAVLTENEVERLMGIIRRLREQGAAILYISHRLSEVEQLADRITVLRDGQLIGTFDGAGLTQADMARLMVGRDFSALYPEPLTPSSNTSPEEIFEVRGAHVPGFVDDVSFKLCAGEILGFAGMIGAGRTELFEGLLGLREGRAELLRLNGRMLRIRRPGDAIAAGIAYLTEDRKGKGLLLRLGLAPNLTLTALSWIHRRLFLNKRREAQMLRSAIDDFDIRVRHPAMLAGQLSGGNQQKLLLAKVLMTDPKLVIIDEPTRGIDIGNKSQIYGFIQGLVKAGKGCIVISSEMQELIGICTRIIVMRNGRISGELNGGDMTEANVALLATGAQGSGRPQSEEHPKAAAGSMIAVTSVPARGHSFSVQGAMQS
jgi:ribose transport system ATP-binding protein